MHMDKKQGLGASGQNAGFGGNFCIENCSDDMREGSRFSHLEFSLELE